MGKRYEFWIALFFCLVFSLSFLWSEEVVVAAYPLRNGNDSTLSLDETSLQSMRTWLHMDSSLVAVPSRFDALSLLEERKIDLVGGLRPESLLEERFCLSSNAYCLSCFCLYVPKGSDVDYQDHEAFDKGTIGVRAEDEKLLGEYLSSQGLSSRVHVYPNDDSLSGALESGQVDFVASSVIDADPSWRIVEKCRYEALRFATWKGNEEMMAKVDEALLFLHGENSQAYGILSVNPLSKQEIDQVKAAPPLCVNLLIQEKPLAWQDDKVCGIIPDFLNLLSQKTGFHFTYAFSPSQGADVDIVSRQGNAPERQEGESEGFLTTSFSLYRQNTHELVDGTPSRIAVSKGWNGLVRYCRQTYPGDTIVECRDSEACLAAVVERKADFAFVSPLVANQIIIQKDYRGVVPVPMTDALFTFSLHFSGKDASSYAAIADKGLDMIDEKEREKIIFAHISQAKPEMTFSYVLQNNRVVSIVLMTLVLVIVAVAVGFVTYLVVMRRQKRKLEIMNKMLSRSNEAKTDFLDKMSHDIRTPMNGIIGLVELSRDEKDPEVLKDNMKKIGNASGYLMDLINDALDMGRIESGTMALSYDLDTVKHILSNTSALIRPSVEEKGLQFHLVVAGDGLETGIKVDSVRLQQVLVNLLSNSVKFTPSGGVVELNVRADVKAGNRMDTCFIVKDTGMGMGNDFMEKGLFQPFCQEHQSFGKNAGCGLGLAMVKRLVTLMKGTVVVESEVGKGSAFTVTIEFETVRGNDKDRTLPSVSPNAGLSFLMGKHILVCEDHELNAEIVKRQLERVGCIVTLAERGDIGLEDFIESKVGFYDAILMDIRMPVMDGLVATREIRALDRNDSDTVPIIALTADAYEEDREKARQAGMNKHLVKPIVPSELYKVLVEQIGKWRK